MNSTSQNVFKFLSYYFDHASRTATFIYQGDNNRFFTEKIVFAASSEAPNSTLPINHAALDRALQLAFILIGTSYFKTQPTPFVQVDFPLDQFQANFFNQVFQEGLSQFAFENQLTRDQLAHFLPTPNYTAPAAVEYQGSGILSLQSGGKDSLLTATLLAEKNLPFTPWYLSSSNYYPRVLDHLIPNTSASVATRNLDLEQLKQSKGLNGHVPITYIVQSLALIQAILFNQDTILTSIGQEGNEPHAMIGDLPVNHQWSKTWPAELYFSEYVRRYISPNLKIGSPLRGFSELYIAELFAQKCWLKFSLSFSSCNAANYQQKTDNSKLSWCGHCPKCVNSFLLFAPFVPLTELTKLFNRDLFLERKLHRTFKGLLGIDGEMKPFECIGSIEELRTAYHLRQPGFGELPFVVPLSNFDYRTTYSVQDFVLQYL